MIQKFILISLTIYSIIVFAWHFDDNKTYDFVNDKPQTLSRRSINDQDNRLIVYSDLKGGSTLYFNSLIY
jgi:hypothetical protein